MPLLKYLDDNCHPAATMAAGPTFVMETFTYVPLTKAMDVISIVSTTDCKHIIGIICAIIAVNQS